MATALFAALGSAPAGFAADAAGDPAQWAMAARDYASTRFSPLDEIRADNVAQLRLAWTFSLGVTRGQEAAPLVVGDTMYVVTPFPNRVVALDLRPPAGRVKWQYQPEQNPAAQGVACCDVVNRGAAFAAGRIVFNTLDAHTIALEAASGRELWRTRMGNVSRGETMTMAPLVVKGTVLVGNSGGELGVRGWIAALDLETGAERWRAFNTGPDADVRIGPRFSPFYPQDRGPDLGVSTWPPDAWQLGGGNVWGWLSYDPELELVYHGTGNPGPWNHEQRPGDNKWTAGVFARDPDTGEAVWFYQWSPHDLYDHDGVNENVLVELTIDGQPRKALVHAERNGYLYVLDRASGQVLRATPFVHVTASKGVDLESGRLLLDDAKRPAVGVVVRDVCPASPGAKDWQPTAWSPRTRLLYVPHNNLCMDYEGLEANYVAGTPYLGATVVMRPGPGGHRGAFSAWDPAAGRRAWTLEEPFPVWSGALATAGDLVFYGTMDRWFKAVHAESGTLLWSFRADSGIVGQPISFRGPDGRQYVAVLAGVGGWAGSIVSGRLDARDASAGKGFAHAMRDLPTATGTGDTLYVFGLP